MAESVQGGRAWAPGHTGDAPPRGTERRRKALGGDGPPRPGGRWGGVTGKAKSGPDKSASRSEQKANLSLEVYLKLHSQHGALTRSDAQKLAA